MNFKEKIKQRRSQMLVHSVIYYWMDSSIVSDNQWQAWANELRDLQRDNPDDCNIGFYDGVFANWDGSTGCHLPKDEWVLHQARRLVDIHEKRCLEK